MSLSTQHQQNGHKIAPYPVTIESATKAVQLCGPDGSRMAVEFYNVSGAQAWIGRDPVLEVTPAAEAGYLDASSSPPIGRPLPVGTSYTDGISADSWWAVSTSGTATVIMVTLVQKNK